MRCPGPRVHRCVGSVGCVVYAVSWATWLLFTAVLARCFELCVRCHEPPRSCSPSCWLGTLCCVCGVLGHLAPVRRCARSVCCFACAVCWVTWLLCTGVLVHCTVWRVCGVLDLLAPVHRCAPSVLSDVCAVSWATGLLFISLPARCVVLLVRCPWPLGSCSPVCPLVVLRCMYGVLGHLALVHRCLGSVFCVACVVSVPTPCARCLGSEARPAGRPAVVVGFRCHLRLRLRGG